MGSSNSAFSRSNSKSKSEIHENDSWPWLLGYLAPEEMQAPNRSRPKKQKSKSKIRFNPIIEEQDYTYYQCETENSCHTKIPVPKYASDQEKSKSSIFEPVDVPSSLYLSPACVNCRRNSEYFQEFTGDKLYPNIRTEEFSTKQPSDDDDHEEPHVTRLNLRSVGLQATTHVILRVRALPDKFNNIDTSDCRPWVSIEYRFNRADDSEHFEVNGPMEDILPGPPSSFRILRSAYERRLSYFFRFLNYFMNNMEGTIWWNGFIINLRGDKRLQVADFAMEPSRLIICLRGIRRLELTRTSRKFQLHGFIDDRSDSIKSFKIRGEAVARLCTTFPKDGTIIVHFPRFFSGM